MNEWAYRLGMITMSKQDGVKGVAVEREEEEKEENVVSKITESTYA